VLPIAAVMSRDAGPRGQEDDRIGVTDRGGEALGVANVAAVDVDIDELAQLSALGDPVAERRELREHIVEGLRHRRAAGGQLTAAAGVLAQDRRDADRAHRTGSGAAEASTASAGVAR
jgi:hypothetical protein